MSKTMKQAAFLMAVALVCALPAIASEAPVQPASGPESATAVLPAAPGCTLSPDTLTFLPEPAAVAQACTLNAAGPEWMASGRPKGYCSCSCSFIRNCSTDADCGSGRCLPGPTCC